MTYDWVLSPTTLLNSRVGYVRHWNPDFGLPEVREYDPVAGLGLVGAVNGIGFPVIGGMFTQTGGGMSEGLAVAGSLPATKKPQALVNITHSRNTHTYKAGFEWRNDIFSNPQIHGSHGQYTFNAQQTALPSTQGQNLGGGAVGLPYASFLLGMVNNAFVSNPTDPNWRKPAVSVFVQDTWRVKSALTLDYGLRWDRQAYGYEEQDRRSMFSPDVAESCGRRPARRHDLRRRRRRARATAASSRRIRTRSDRASGRRIRSTRRPCFEADGALTYAQTGIGQADGGSTLGAGGWNTFNFQSPGVR